jgi:uncharacterized protein (TIGR02145 family)
MATLPQELLDAIEALVEEKFDELIKAHKVNPSEIDQDVVTFEEEQMLPFDGYEPIDQGFFRKFLAWLKFKMASIVITIQETTFDAIRYIQPVDYDPAPDCGKIIAPFANLSLDGADIKPTIPNPPETTPDLAGFDQASDIMLAGMAYNKTDNKWYYRGKLTLNFNSYLYNYFAATKEFPFSDYFLPSLDELIAMRDELHVYGVGNFNETYNYWSSSEYTYMIAYSLSFMEGSGGGQLTQKDGQINIRPCRSFISEAVYNLRDIGPGSGWIFIIIDNEDGTFTYYETAPHDITRTWWGNNFEVPLVGVGTAIGTGQSNTTAIVNQEGQYGGAAIACDDLTITVTIAPDGWKVPTVPQFLTLQDYVAANPGVLKMTGFLYWKYPNTGATNTAKFNSIGIGQRQDDGSFLYRREQSSYWSSTKYLSSMALTLRYESNGILIEGRSDNWGQGIRLIKESTNLTNGESGTMTDIDGNVYPTICIGTQEYMAEDLKVTHYNNGVHIPNITDNAQWAGLMTGARCLYNNTVEYDIDYIYDLKEALHLGIVDITGLQTILDSLVVKEEGKGLSENDLTDDLKEMIDTAESHMNIENIHIPPDGISIQQSDDDALEVIPEWIRDLFSADLPLALDENGKITLAIDETTLDIIDGKLTVIGGGDGGAKLSFVPETGILSVDPGGDSSVDLSSLAAGEGVDLSNYVKKTGELTQTVEGDLKVTGEVEPFA